MDLPLFFGFSMLFSSLLLLSNHCFHSFFLMKNHDKFLSTFPCNLEKKCVKNYYFPAFPSSLSTGKFVTCGF